MWDTVQFEAGDRISFKIKNYGPDEREHPWLDRTGTVLEVKPTPDNKVYVVEDDCEAQLRYVYLHHIEGRASEPAPSKADH